MRSRYLTATLHCFLLCSPQSLADFLRGDVWEKIILGNDIRSLVGNGAKGNKCEASTSQLFIFSWRLKIDQNDFAWKTFCGCSLLLYIHLIKYLFKDFKAWIFNYFMSENWGGFKSYDYFYFFFFFISTVLVLRITDAKWEGVSVCKKKASCSRGKADIHHHK